MTHVSGGGIKMGTVHAAVSLAYARMHLGPTAAELNGTQKTRVAQNGLAGASVEHAIASTGAAIPGGYIDRSTPDSTVGKRS